MIGQALAHYKILEKIGSGGMGEVYLAEDTKLDRKVALKVLPPELAESDERRSRFEREAKAVAALDHPNIVQVFSVEKAEGIHFFTMQLVHGKTLTELIQKDGFALNEFFEIAIPLANAVAAAHEERITHRDLKPDNVMVGDDGRVRVLDFGLAKPTAGFKGDGAGSELPTAAKTEQGAVIGTLHYMSPEQAQGKSVDARSDIFSIGIVLYEMLTGNRPFGGDTPAGVLSSVIKDMPPSVAEARPEIPRELSKMVQRCLAKEPSRRIQSALDIRNELEELKADLSSGELGEVRPSSGPSSINKGLVAATVVLVMALVGTLVYVSRTTDSSVPRLANPVQVSSAVGVEDHATWSPDGERLAYEFSEAGYYFGGRWDIWVAQVAGGDPVNLTADHAGSHRYPSWSPDGTQIAFWTQTSGTWGVSTMSALGGSSRRLFIAASDAVGAPQWAASGRELAIADRDANGNFVHIVSLPTLETRRVPLPDHDGNRCSDLRWSPDGRAFAYVDAIPSAEITQLWVMASTGGEPTAVTDGFTNVWSPDWSADGSKLLYVSNQGGTMDLWQQRIGQDSKPEGEPEPVTSGLELRSAAFSPDGGKLAYTRGRWMTNVWRIPILPDRQATWTDAQQITFDNAFIQFLDLSPDGTRLVLSSDRAGNQDLWTLPSEGGVMTPLTTDPTPDWAPRWSPDGNQIVFYAYRSGNRDVWIMPADGGPARQITSDPGADASPAWTSDSSQITFNSWRRGNRDIWIVNAEGGESRQFIADPASDANGDWSPDGEWFVFESSRTGENRLWIASAAGDEVHQLSQGWAHPLSELETFTPRWSVDSKIVFARHPENNILAHMVKGHGERQVTNLVGRRGSLDSAMATYGSWIYFTWSEDLGDIWVMDVVQGE